MPRRFLNGIDLSNQRIINVGDPSNPTDAVNRQFVENTLRGLSIKEAVRVASTANITVATPGATIDGVTMVSGDRVLLKDQTTQSQNGIYVWNGAATAMTRSLDADDGTEIRSGVSVFVREGTVNADRQYVMTSDVTITIGTTAQTWTQFGGGTTYTGSNGVQLVGNDFRGVVAPSGGLTVGASGFAIDTSIVTRKVSGTMGNGSLTSITINHGLNTQDVDVTIRQTSNNEVVDTDWVALDNNQITFTFAVAPASNSIRWTVMG